MAMLTPPNPRFKPMLTSQDMGQGMPQPTQVLREAPQAQTVNGRTPQQIAKERAMAEAMIGQGMDFSPVQHWAQGLARVAQAASGAWQEKNLAEEEAAGRAGFKSKLDAYDPKAPDADRIAMALVNDPWASEGARGFVNAQMARDNPAPTGDQRNYRFAQSPEGGGFKGTFTDYQTLANAPVGLAAGSSPNAPSFEPRVVNQRPVPAGVQGAEDDDIAAVQSTEQINNQLQSVADQINDGTLDLGFFANMASRGQNFLGASSKGSVAFANMQATLEKMRNDSLRLNKGVQTDMDAVRAWNELIANVNDPKVVLDRIKTIQGLNVQAKEFRKQMLDIRRQRNNMDPLDPSLIGMGAGAAPEAPTSPPAGATPVGAAAPKPSPTQIQKLKANPGRASEFDEMFGPGASAAILGGQGGPELIPPDADPYGIAAGRRQREEMNARHKRMLTNGP